MVLEAAVGGSVVHWSYEARTTWESPGRVPADWLSAAECEELNTLHGKRAAAWLAGRALAKKLLLAATFAQDPRELSILSLDGKGLRNRPEVYCRGVSTCLCLSLAHTDNFVAAAWNTSGKDIGIDIEEAQTLSRGFAKAWLLPSEQQLLEQNAAAAETTLRIWSAKEAAYKSAHAGEAFDALRAEVQFMGATAGLPSSAADGGIVTYRDGLSQLRTCDVVWQQRERVLVTISMVRKGN